MKEREQESDNAQRQGKIKSRDNAGAVEQDVAKRVRCDEQKCVKTKRQHRLAAEACDQGPLARPAREQGDERSRNGEKRDSSWCFQHSLIVGCVGFRNAPRPLWPERER